MRNFVQWNYIEYLKEFIEKDKIESNLQTISWFDQASIGLCIMHSILKFLSIYRYIMSSKANLQFTLDSYAKYHLQYFS